MSELNTNNGWNTMADINSQPMVNPVMINTHAVGSLSQISAQNYYDLNSSANTEEYHPLTNTRPYRVIGEVEEHSPVGDMIVPLLLMACVYVIIKAWRRARMVK